MQATALSRRSQEPTLAKSQAEPVTDLLQVLKDLVNKYGLPYVVYNQGSIVHLECTGAMSYDFSSMKYPQVGSPDAQDKARDAPQKVRYGRDGAATWQTVSLPLPVAVFTLRWQIPTRSSTVLLRDFDDVFKNVKVCPADRVFAKK